MTQVTLAVIIGQLDPCRSGTIRTSKHTLQIDNNVSP